MKKNLLILSMLIMVLIVPSVMAQIEDASLSAELSTYDPIPAIPGRSVDIWITLQNLGNAEAKDVTVEFVDTSAFTLQSENDRITKISRISSRSDYLLKYKVKVSQNAIDGTNYLTLKYGLNGLNYEKKIGIDVKSTDAPITISSVKVEPNPIVPGSKSKVTISIKNLASSINVRDLTVSMGLSPVAVSTTVIDLPFVPVGSASRKTIDVVRAGQTSEVSFDIAAYPNAKAQIYKIPVTLSFSDDSGKDYEEIVLIGLEVNSKPDVLVIIENGDITTQTKEGEIIFDITNRGLSDVKLMTATLEDADGFEVLSPSNTLYIGNVDSDDFESASFDIKATKEGNLKLPLKIEFKDSFNNKHTEEFELEYVVRDGDSNKGSSGTIIFVVIIIIIIVGVIIYKRRKKKQKRRTK